MDLSNNLHLYRSILLWCGSRQSLWPRYSGGSLQSLPVCWSPDLWHKCRSDACSGKKELIMFELCTCNHGLTTSWNFINIKINLKLPMFSGSSRLDRLKESTWVIISGWHVSSCIASVKTLVWSPHLTPSQSLVTGTVPAAIQTSAQRRWGKMVD